MAKFPHPPAVERLADIPPDIRILPAGSLVWRVYFRAGRHPTLWNRFRYFGPGAARFDHHLRGPAGEPRAQARGIVYAAFHGLTCLAEVFQTSRIIDRRAGEPWLVGFTTARPLSLLDLTGLWPTRAGASMAINSGPRPRAQAWSRQAYSAYAKVEGLHYASSLHANRPALAIYERGADALPRNPDFHRALADPVLDAVLSNAARDLGYGLL